jgi:hypothetical protein
VTFFGNTYLPRAVGEASNGFCGVNPSGAIARKLKAGASKCYRICRLYACLSKTVR